MKLNIRGRDRQRKLNPDWFTGRTWMKVLSKGIGSKGQDMYHVHFEGGARTKLHSHDGEQVLVCTGGSGSLETFRRYGTARSRFRIKRARRVRLGDGDVVCIPAGTLHTHGAVGGGSFSHIAINVLGGRSSYGTAWYESDFREAVTGAI